jgi:hypothetical protein
MKGVPQDAAPRVMKVATKYEWASVAPFGSGDWQSSFASSAKLPSPHGNYVSILLASPGTIHGAVQGPRAATAGLQRKTVLSVKKLQQFLRFQAN